MAVLGLASLDDGAITCDVEYDTVTLKASTVAIVNNSATKTLTVTITNGQQTRTFNFAPGTSRTVNLPNGFTIDQLNAPIVVTSTAA